MAIPDTFTKAQLRALKNRYSNFRSRHFRRYSDGGEVLTFERFLSIAFSDCVYCGAPPSGTMHCKDGTLLHINTLDRIDSARGYESENVVPACINCNMGKGTLSASEWFEHVARIYEYQKLGERGIHETGDEAALATGARRPTGEQSGVEPHEPRRLVGP